jgi:uncharacterized membrane protein
MNYLVAAMFDDEYQADEVRTELLRSGRVYKGDLDDSVVAVCKRNGGIRLRLIHDVTPTGAVSGGIWGSAIALIFLHPRFGISNQKAAGAIAGGLTDVVLDDAFVQQLAQRFRPGSSALFVLARQLSPETVMAEFERYQGHAVHTALSSDNEEELRAAVKAANLG